MALITVTLAPGGVKYEIDVTKGTIGIVKAPAQAFSIEDWKIGMDALRTIASLMHKYGYTNMVMN